MKLLLISVFLISLVCFMSIPDVFGVTYPINVPMGSAAGLSNAGYWGFWVARLLPGSKLHPYRT